MYKINIGIFTVVFCVFSASNWVQYIYAVSCVAAGIVYFVVCFDALKLRKAHPGEFEVEVLTPDSAEK